MRTYLNIKLDVEMHCLGPMEGVLAHKAAVGREIVFHASKSASAETLRPSTVKRAVIAHAVRKQIWEQHSDALEELSRDPLRQ